MTVKSDYVYLDIDSLPDPEEVSRLAKESVARLREIIDEDISSGATKIWLDYFW